MLKKHAAIYTLFCGFLASALLCAWATTCRAEDTAKAIIEKAIKAHGGADKLAQLRVRQVKSKFTYELGGRNITDTMDSLDQLPEQRKCTFDYEFQGRRSTYTKVINGDKGWITSGGKMRDYTAEQVKFLKVQVHLDYLVTLAPLQKEKGFTLSPLGEIKVNDRPALGVKVIAKGHEDVDLYFDKKSSLLTKSVVKIVNAFNNDEYEQEILYSDYKAVEGLKWPMKMIEYRNGKQSMETEITELKFLDKIDDSEFAKP